jgi:hypothetical protein
MGVRVELVDRDVYATSLSKSGHEKRLSERDKFLLSERDNLPSLKTRRDSKNEVRGSSAPIDLRDPVTLVESSSENGLKDDFVYSGASGKHNLETAVH